MGMKMRKVTAMGGMKPEGEWGGDVEPGWHRDTEPR